MGDKVEDKSMEEEKDEFAQPIDGEVLQQVEKVVNQYGTEVKMQTMSCQKKLANTLSWCSNVLIKVHFELKKKGEQKAESPKLFAELLKE